ncbi:hypothetical protein BDW71DRAFT_203339 [Aspergillus fruticulosus]
MSSYEIHAGKGEARWFIVLRLADDPKCTLYTSELSKNHYDHKVLEEQDFESLNFASLELIATVPEADFLKFETGCPLAASPGPTKHYVVRVLYMMLAAGYVEQDVALRFKREAEYSDEEKAVRDGWYVKRDEEFYARV